jgi:Fic family protein
MIKELNSGNIATINNERKVIMSQYEAEIARLKLFITLTEGDLYLQAMYLRLIINASEKCKKDMQTFSKFTQVEDSPEVIQGLERVNERIKEMKELYNSYVSLIEEK